MQTQLPPVVSPVPYQTPKVTRPVRRRFRPWMYWVVGGVVVLAVACGITAWRHAAEQKLAAQGNVNLQTVSFGNVRKSVDSSGTVIANVDVDIKCQANGPIAKLPVDKSSIVKAGDLLCQLDPKDEHLLFDAAQENLNQAQAKVEQAKLAYDLAERNLKTTRAKVESSLAAAKVKAANLQSKADRQKELVAQKLGSSEDFETAQTDAAVARDAAVAAQVAIDELDQQAIQLASKKFDITAAESVAKQQELNLATAKRQLDYTTVLSPMDGIVTSLGDKIAVGAQIESGAGGFSGGTTIMSIADRSHIYVTATVDQSDFAGVKEEGGQRALVTIDSYPGRTFEGKTVRRAPEGKNTSNVVTFDVKVEVTDKDKQLLWPAMTGTVTIVEAERDNVLTVPTAAVIHHGDKTTVKTADGKERAVTVGLEGGDVTEVTSGLKAGEQVLSQPEELPSKWKSNEGGPGGPK